MADKVKIGTMWLGGCSGCHLSIADFHESLLDILELADFEFSPVLMDTKYDEVPELDVLIVEGGIRNEENRELAEMLNENPEECIALEDSKNGLLSAYRAGCKPIMVPDLWQPDEEILQIIKGKYSDLEQVKKAFESGEI